MADDLQEMSNKDLLEEALMVAALARVSKSDRAINELARRLEAMTAERDAYACALANTGALP